VRGFEVLTAVLLKIRVFWDVTLSGSWHFKGLIHQNM